MIRRRRRPLRQQPSADFAQVSLAGNDHPLDLGRATLASPEVFEDLVAMAQIISVTVQSCFGMKFGSVVSGRWESQVVPTIR